MNEYQKVTALRQVSRDETLASTVGKHLLCLTPDRPKTRSHIKWNVTSFRLTLRVILISRSCTDANRESFQLD